MYGLNIFIFLLLIIFPVLLMITSLVLIIYSNIFIMRKIKKNNFERWKSLTSLPIKNLQQNYGYRNNINVIDYMFNKELDYEFPKEKKLFRLLIILVVIFFILSIIIPTIYALVLSSIPI